MDRAAGGNPYEIDLDKNPANYAPLTPLQFIERAAYVYPKRLAVVHGALCFTWAETYARCRRLASALAKRGIGRGDTVAAMLANTPEMYECHFGVPMAGGVLNTLNTRLDGEAIAFMLEHGEAEILITDREFAPTMEKALGHIKRKILVVDVDDPEYAGPGEKLGSLGYEQLLAEGDPSYEWQRPADEWDAISLNYT
ncbi:MAG: AMP-binding protein, partial [Candidatus Rokuibacteriota bacterium]